MDLTAALDEWVIHLRAERKSPQTIKTYGDGVRRFITWCAAEDLEPDLEPALVNRFTVDLLDAGSSPATVASRQLAVRRISTWAAAEGIIAADRLTGLKRPKIDTPVMEPLSEDELKALLKACKGTELRDRRDEAIVRLMMETGIRAGECIALQIPDVDLATGTATIRRGKGGKGRVVGFGAQTSQAIARYLRIRKAHRLSDTPALWLGDRGKPFVYDGLYSALRGRAKAAGISRFHPHLLRNTFAHRWLAAGGSESGLMAGAGWTRPEMMLRYAKHHEQSRAVAESQRLNLGDL